MDNTDIKPPSDDYEVIIGDGDWIIPEGAKIYLKVRDVNGVFRRDWFSALSLGEVSLVKSTYAIPKWVNLEVGDVLPQGYEYRSRRSDDVRVAGLLSCVGEKLNELALRYAEYRAPAPPLRRMSDTVDSLKAEIAKLKQENAQLAEKAENWRKLYLDAKGMFDELYEDRVKWQNDLRAKPIIDMTLREIMRETINASNFDPEA